ncbi:MAG TPA: hypothetical protein VGS41_11085, partial [Chthonomonadales bacterium]|nr:hypothetical protein [Chthonomonadales bacterium]
MQTQFHEVEPAVTSAATESTTADLEQRSQSDILFIQRLERQARRQIGTFRILVGCYFAIVPVALARLAVPAHSVLADSISLVQIAQLPVLLGYMAAARKAGRTSSKLAENADLKALGVVIEATAIQRRWT